MQHNSRRSPVNGLTVFNLTHQSIEIHDIEGLESTAILRKSIGDFLRPPHNHFTSAVFFCFVSFTDIEDPDQMITEGAI